MDYLTRLASYLPTNVLERIEDVSIEILKRGPIPKHIAFIMDGNRRYAKMNGMSTPEGYNLGFKSLEKILDSCLKLGVMAVTVYAFSIDNFKRPKYEVEALMNLAKEKLNFFCTQSEMIKKHEVSIRVIGKLSLLPKDVLEVMNKAVKETSHYNKAILTICFPYTSTDEINHVITKCLENPLKYGKKYESLMLDDIEKEFYTSDLPKLDMLVRTSGEIRLSDFLLWQTSIHNSQIHFVKVLWPKFSIWHLLPIILSFQCNLVIRDNQE